MGRRHHATSDVLLHRAERVVPDGFDPLISRVEHKPNLGSKQTYRRKHLELQATIGATHGRSSLRNQSIIEFVFCTAASANNIH
jgi:hypothetical protein